MANACILARCGETILCYVDPCGLGEAGAAGRAAIPCARCVIAAAGELSSDPVGCEAGLVPLMTTDDVHDGRAANLGEVITGHGNKVESAGVVPTVSGAAGML